MAWIKPSKKDMAVTFSYSTGGLGDVAVNQRKSTAGSHRDVTPDDMWLCCTHARSLSGVVFSAQNAWVFLEFNCVRGEKQTSWQNTQENNSTTPNCTTQDREDRETPECAGR